MAKVSHNTPLAYLMMNYDEVGALEFYRELFPVGSFEDKAVWDAERQEWDYSSIERYDMAGRKQWKYNAIAIEVTKQKRRLENGREKPIVHRYTVTDDLDVLRELQSSNNFCLMAPISYVGKERKAENARQCFAIVIDVDRIKMKGEYPVGLHNMLFQTTHKPATEIYHLPKPTFVVASGTGVHVYYVLEQPVRLFYSNSQALQKLKAKLTEKIWNDGVVEIKSKADIQQEGIYQGFRIVGTITKKGERVQAFRTGEKVSIEYLKQFVPASYMAYIDTSLKCQARSVITLEEALEKCIDWKPGSRKQIPFNRAVYDNWLKRIREEASVGHRYHCIATLAVYAKKCSFYDEKKNPDPVTYEELEQDALDLVDIFDAKSDDEDNRFTVDDVYAALEFYHDRYTNMTRDRISKKTAIEITPKIDRNWQKQADHLEEARMIRDLRQKRKGRKWYEGGGRPSKENLVREYMIEHPYSSGREIAEALHISTATAYKHMKKIREESSWNL